MVKRLYSKKIFWSAITFFVIASLLFASHILAKQLQIKAADAERIKMVLDITQTMTNVTDLILKDKDFLTILNTVIGGGKTATDITYGLVVLSALGEMDFIDLVISQEYKREAREYFNRVLDERISLNSYWKGVGADIPKVLSGYITGPAAALTLNSFAITDKTIAIFIEFNVLGKMKLYDGLWYYFDLRKQGNEPHSVAWGESKIVMGGMAGSLHGFYKETKREDNLNQLEQQFQALYERWAPYATPYGISEEYKKQVKSELSGVLIAATEENAALAESEPEPSLIEKLTQQLDKLKETTAALISRVNPLKAGIVLNLPEEPEIAAPIALPEELAEDIESQPKEIIETELEAEPTIDDLQEDLDDILEEVDIIEQDIIEKTEKILSEKETPKNDNQGAEKTEGEETESPAPSNAEPAPAPEPLPMPAPPASAPVLSIEPALCERGSDNPTRFRVLINEVAWAGTAKSADDEWIELKNIWGIPVDLRGWRLQDKDGQIKIIFGENDLIAPDNYYLLERTDDNSMPGVKADLIYAGALNDTDEALYLFDADCRIEDEIIASSNWPAGDSGTKKSMQRFDNLYWYPGSGTPKNKNASPPASFTHAGVPAAAPAVVQSVYPEIIITETYIGDAENQKNDFVELYNPNSEPVGLANWYLQRKTAAGQNFSSYAPQDLFAAKTISAKSYFLITNTSSTFATSADIVTTHPLTKNNILAIKNPEQNIVDEVSSGDPAAGKSYGRKWSSATLNYTEDFEDQAPTPRAQNQNTGTGESGGEEGGGNGLSSIVINEVAWAGTEANAFDEWIELYNSATSSIDIEEWRLNSSGAGGIDIIFSTTTSTTTTVPAQGFFLIERTDDSAVSDVSADWAGSFGNGLSNSRCEILYLYDNKGNLIDETACSDDDWPGGKAGPDYVSMERITSASGTDPQNWASNNLITKNGLDADEHPINGTPKAENSVAKSLTEIIGGLNIAEDFILTRLGSPYIIEGSVKIGAGAKLKIEPGVIIKFKHNDSWKSEFQVEGELEAIGGEVSDQKIVFTSFRDATGTQPAMGDWEWFYFKNARVAMENVLIKYAGRKEGSPPFSPLLTRGTIYIDGGNVAIKNSVIEKSRTLGIWLTNSASTTIDGVEFSDIAGDWEKPAAVFVEDGAPTIANSIFKNNNTGILVEHLARPIINGNSFEGNQIPIQIDTLLPVISNNVFSDNDYNGIYLPSLSFPAGQVAAVWPVANIPYIIGTLNIVSGVTVQIEAGTVIKFLSTRRLNIEGNLEAVGTADNKIIFTSFQDDEYGGDTNNDGASTQPDVGRWHFIYFAPSSTGSILDNVIVRYGGWFNVFEGGPGAKSGAVRAEGTILTVKNSLLENNLYCGLELIHSDSEIRNTVFRGHAADYFWGQRSAGILIEDSVPALKKTVFNNNYYGLYVNAATCPDLSEAEFGEGNEANSVDVFPSGCAP